MKFNKIYLSIILISLVLIQSAYSIPLEKRAYSTLKVGSKGQSVKNLQNKLISLGYSIGGGASGNFGAHTKFAVYAFQQVNGLSKDGIAGSATQTRLFGSSAKRNTVNGDETGTRSYSTLQKGSKGEAVKRLQIRLVLLGYSVGSAGADGDFGNNTFSAVKKFQSFNGISSNGIANAATQKKLFSRTAVNAKKTPASITKFVNTALQEFGYRGTGSGSSRYSKYGSFYGVNPGHWCAMFVSWVGADNGSVSTHIIKKTSAVSNFMTYFKNARRYVAKAKHRPQYGDIMLLKGAGNSHVAIVVGSDANYVYTIEGNYSNKVAAVRRKRGSAKITGYGKNNSGSYGYTLTGSFVSKDS